MMKVLIALLVLVIVTIIVIVNLSPSAQAAPSASVAKDKETILVEPSNPPYSTQHIMSLADYDDAGGAVELEVVARNTVEKKFAAQQFNTARLPPDSQVRAVDEARWTFAAADPKVLEGFSTIEGKNLQPDDKDALEAQERAILATYVPKRSADLMTYSVEDTEDLIKKIYDAKKQIPSFKKRDDGVYEVYEVKDKDPKIVWEDDVAGDALASVGDAIHVPVVAEQVAANLDPFFEPRTRLSNNRADYTAFTPQLERMFAPTEPRLHWY